MVLHKCSERIRRVNRKAIWAVGAMVYFFAFAGGLFLAKGNGVTPTTMFVAGNILGAVMMSLITLWCRIANSADGSQGSARDFGEAL